MATDRHPSPLIRTVELVKAYSMDHHRLVALNRVNLTFQRGEFAGLIGPSGSGKTTLLNILGSLDQPTEGSAEVLGEKIESLSHKKAAELRSRHIGFIFQTHNLLPVYTVYENVEFPLLVLGVPTSERRKAVMDASSGSGSRTGPTRGRPSSPAGKASEWRLRGPSSRGRRSFWPMSQPHTWTARTRATSWTPWPD